MCIFNTHCTNSIQRLYLCATSDIECNAFSEFNAFSGILSEFEVRFLKISPFNIPRLRSFLGKKLLVLVEKRARLKLGLIGFVFLGLRAVSFS